METWYAAWCGNTPKIRPVKIEKATPLTVQIDGLKFSKVTPSERYFETYEEARDFLIALWKTKTSGANRALTRAMETMELATNMKPAQ